MGREAERKYLLGLIDEAFSGAAWHGPTLAGSVRGLTAQQAGWRPGRGRHCIWELVLHTAYWKYAVRRRLTEGAFGGFPREGSNWLPLPEPRTPVAWRRDLTLLKAEHHKLRAAVATVPFSRLGRKGGRGRWTNAEMIRGIALHDVYHAGQVQLLKRLQGARRR